MPIELKMPALSPTMEEGNLAKWLVKEGDSVSSGDVIAEIETDKATMEVEAVDEGTVAKILVPAGTEAVKVNALIAILAEEGEDPAAVHMWRLMIAAEQQGKGYGKAAIAEAVAQTRAWGFQKLGTSVVDSPDSNIGFYESLGFRRTGGFVDDEIALIREL